MVMYNQRLKGDEDVVLLINFLVSAWTGLYILSFWAYISVILAWSSIVHHKFKGK